MIHVKQTASAVSYKTPSQELLDATASLEVKKSMPRNVASHLSRVASQGAKALHTQQRQETMYMSCSTLGVFPVQSCCEQQHLQNAIELIGQKKN